jgi:hypothetical protein
VEFSVQYMIDCDWHRVSAIYEYLNQAADHGKDLLMNGSICRLIGRSTTPGRETYWYTVKIDAVTGRIGLDNPIPFHYK